MQRRVSIILFRMFHYRVDFLTRLREELKKHDVMLDVYFGKPTPESIAKNDTGELPGSTEIPSYCLRLGGKEILLQIPPRRILSSELTICMQENRLLVNYFLQLYTRVARGRKFAFWGHGRNFQSLRATGVREAWKRFLLRGSDWFFAYTDASRDSLLDSGYDADKISVFNNTIDAEKFRALVGAVSEEQQRQFLDGLSIPPGAIVGLFCGSMYPAKRITELLSACKLIRQEIPGFHLVCIGDGPSASEIKTAQTRDDWIHYLGVQTGLAKAQAYAVASAVLNPGLVGLHIVDSFSAGIPMLTMDYEFHSPEFAYMESGHNGLVTAADEAVYAAAAIALFRDSERLQQLSLGAHQSAGQYSLQAMVDAYTAGILKAIEN